VTGETSVRRRLRLRAGAWTDTGTDGAVWLVSRRRGISLGDLGLAERAVLARLAEAAGWAEDELADVALAEGGMRGLLAVEGLLDVLRCGGWLATSLVLGDRVLLTLNPDTVRRAAGGSPPGGGRVLSRFAVLRRESGTLLLESPVSGSTVEIADPEVLAVLGQGGNLPAAVTAEVTDVLAAAGFLVPAEASEQDSLQWAQWSPHELWFHARSRLSTHDQPFGGTYWAKGRFDPLPARHPRYRECPAVELFRPDLTALRRTDMTLTEALETRRSVRAHHAENPLTGEQLGEFLYRTARTRGTAHDGSEELCDRPYPSGGGLHELELYPVVTHVAGIEPGMYHYDGHGHRLELVTGADPAAVRRLVHIAGRMALMEAPPQVLVVVSARFGRLMWKYQAMGYALILKHVGVLYQTMYGVATAMGLAACGLGAGDVDEFAAVTGLDPRAESSVGEFLLGSVHPDVARTGSANPAAARDRD
jgi:SagB-type dehydrogenase family enzyme